MKEPLFEQLKWIGKMNHIRSCAKEILNGKIIYA